MSGDAAVAVTETSDSGAEVVKLATPPVEKKSKKTSKPKAKVTKAKAEKKPAKKNKAVKKAAKTSKASAAGHKAQTQVSTAAWKLLCAAAKSAECSTPAEWIRDVLYKKLGYKDAE